ncbi:hypothetical protein quinque_012488 [Culex quinquefasciatus]
MLSEDEDCIHRTTLERDEREVDNSVPIQGLIKYDLLAAPHNSHGWCPLASPETVSTTTVPRTNRRTTEIPSPSLAAATPTRTGPHD